MKEKIVLIGAGSAIFTRGLVADMANKNWEAELDLVDIDQDALLVAEKLAKKLIEAKNAPIKLCATTDRKQALKNATVVICTIAVGGRKSREHDVFIPRKYGIYQPVGDSVMPGGTSRALRMIPPMVEIAKDVLDLAPEALFFNYANPMAVICRAVRKATDANIIGLCHGVFDFGKYLANICKVEPEEFKYTTVGMNHLGWVTDVRINGKDAMERLREISKVKVPTPEILSESSKIEEENLLTWELFRRFGVCPVPGDRHVVEFFPQMFPEGKYYGRTLGVDVHSFEASIEFGNKRHKESQEEAFSRKPLGEDFLKRISGEHEQVIDIIESIRKDAAKIYSANLPNAGQLPDLPLDVIVETPAVADGKGLNAILQKPLPAALAGILIKRFMWVETIVEAALEGSREKFIQALLLDEAVNSFDVANKIADEFLMSHAEYLPQFMVNNTK